METRDPGNDARVVEPGARRERRSTRSTAMARAREALCRPGRPRPPEERAAVLVRRGEMMRQEQIRHSSAVEVFECGKPWREADADVAEAIDFCEFYAREMIRLGSPRRARRPRRDEPDRARSPEASSS